MNPQASLRGRAFLFQELPIVRTGVYFAALQLAAIILVIGYAVLGPSNEGYTVQYMDESYCRGYVEGARQNRKPPIYHFTTDKETYPLVKAEVEAQISQMLGRAKKGSPRKWN